MAGLSYTAANPLALGLTVAGTGDLVASAKLRQSLRATTGAALLLAARRSSLRLPALSAALAGSTLDLGSARKGRLPQAAALVRVGVLLAMWREAKRIEAWERA